MDGHIAKPIKVERLFAAIEDALEAAAAAAEAEPKAEAG